MGSTVVDGASRGAQLPVVDLDGYCEDLARALPDILPQVPLDAWPIDVLGGGHGAPPTAVACVDWLSVYSPGDWFAVAVLRAERSGEAPAFAATVVEIELVSDTLEFPRTRKPPPGFRALFGVRLTPPRGSGRNWLAGIPEEPRYSHYLAGMDPSSPAWEISTLTGGGGRFHYERLHDHAMSITFMNPLRYQVPPVDFAGLAGRSLGEPVGGWLVHTALDERQALVAVTHDLDDE